MAARIYTDEEELMIARIYQAGNSAKAIGRAYGKDKTPILGALRRQGITQRTPADRNRLYPCNATIFDVIDTEAKAYWLGFLFADGNVKKRTLSLGLAPKDIDHVRAFAKFMDSDAPIQTNAYNAYGSAHVHITDEHLANRLIELGFVAWRPDHTACVGAVPASIMSHFLRGLFDGDGSAKKSRAGLSFLGSYALMGFIRETLAAAVGTNPNLKILAHTISKEAFYLNFMGRPQSLRIANYLYRDASIFLVRKRNVILNWKAPQPHTRDGLGRFNS